MVLDMVGILDIPTARSDAERLAFVKLTEAMHGIIDVAYTWCTDDEASGTLRLHAEGTFLTSEQVEALEIEAWRWRAVHPRNNFVRWMKGDPQ